MILTGCEIQNRVYSGQISISDFDEKRLGPNSYNLRLSPHIAIYNEVQLDCKRENRISRDYIDTDGYLLEPGKLYLAMTLEETSVKGDLVPMIEGRSSIGRLGIRIHATAGFGDIGFSGNWTLEIDVVQPVKIYAGIEICQIFYHTTLGGLTKTYKGKYQGSKLPLPSAIWKEFQQE